MRVHLAEKPSLDLDVEVLVVPELELDHLSPLAASVDARVGGRLERARKHKELTGKLGETTWIHTEGSIAAPRLLVVGLGKRDELDAERMRRAGATAARQLRRREVATAAVALPPELGHDLVATFADGLVTGDFDVGVYKSKDRKDQSEIDVHVGVVVGQPPGPWSESLKRGAAMGSGANIARKLALEPGNRLTPTGLADRARTIAAEHGLECEVLDEARLREIGAGALLGVSQGSLEPPCMIVLRYRGGSGGPTLALIGKGVTFDSGGISIKGSQGMHEMKYDMAGGAATIGAMAAIAELKPRADVIGIVPATENLPSGRAMKPGDVLTSLSGTTIEVTNTDAEGRIILGDALTYAQQQGATYLIDAATLTGAVVTALGHQATGLFGTPDSWVERVKVAATRAGDRVWHLPLFPEYRELLKSDVADIGNSGGRQAGASTGATFIKEFVNEGVNWAHLDIAGTAWTTSDKAWQPSGPTAAGLRIFVEVALEMARQAEPVPV